MTSQTRHQLTSLPQDSLASPSQQQDSVPGWAMTVGSSETLSLFGDEQGHVGSSWRTCPACAVQTTVKPSGRSSIRLPKSGRLANGHIYERPTSVPATVENDGSALLLGTPRAAHGMQSSLRDAEAIGNPHGRLEDQIALLKTPTSNLGTNGGSQHPEKRKEGGHGPTLADEIEHLLPTPTASQAGGTAEQHLERKRRGKMNRANPTVTDLGLLVEHLANTPPPSPNSKPYSDGQHQNQPLPASGYANCVGLVGAELTPAPDRGA